MSDIFNHMEDAFNDLFGSFENGQRIGEDSGTAPNPLCYHTEVSYNTIKHSTDKAYLLNMELCGSFVDVWFPKSICRNLNTSNKTVFIHTKTYLSIIQNRAKEILGKQNELAACSRST